MPPSTFPLMRGITTLRGYISAYLESAVPALIDIARIHWPVDEFHLPYPRDYNIYDFNSVTSFPAIGFAAVDDRSWGRVDVNDCAEQEYWPIYSLRVMIVARTPMDGDEKWIQPEKMESIRLRDDLTGLVKAALLQDPTMGHPDEVRFIEDTMTTSYLDTIKPTSQSSRWISASLIAVEFKLRQFTHLPHLGVVNVTTPEVGKLA